ncbi:MAG: hypothetical protein HY075_14985, partial [Deltaproteobacteria bacterium]|nr:hypothetical protein [Deltaproteobacteria bacterium]
MRNSPLLLVVGLVVLFAAGCTGPDPETLQACDAKGACPSGFSCNVDDNKCYDDSLGPNTMLLNHPDAVTNQTTAVFEFASPETLDATFECKLDDKAYAPCQSAFHAVVAEGTHKFRVRAVLGGTADPSPASYTWTVDSSTPDTMITGGPSGTVSMSEASFTFSSNEAQATFTCQLDDKPAERCTSGKSYALQDGAHVFRVYATDPAGNVDPTPAEAHFTVDTMGPVVTIDSGPQGGATVGPAVRFTFTVDASGPEVATIACSIDGAALPCAGGSVDAVLKSGVHTFVVVATDPIGNQGEAMRAFTVDATGPVVTITSPASGET